MVPVRPRNRSDVFYTDDNEDNQQNHPTQNPRPSWAGQLGDSQLVTKDPRPNSSPASQPNDSGGDP